MAAANHHPEVSQFIGANVMTANDVTGKNAQGGRQAVLVTQPTGIPLIREWEFAQGPIIAFSKLDSCLGALQIVNGTLMGAHFSQFADNMTLFDGPGFHAAIAQAGFSANLPIRYFGGSTPDWKDGLNLNGSAAPQFPLNFPDAAQHCWIFELNAGVFTHFDW